jgi:hypothetical protein
MAKFIEVAGGLVNADRLLLVEPERDIYKGGELTGYARIVFDDGHVERTPLGDRTVADLVRQVCGEPSTT